MIKNYYICAFMLNDLFKVLNDIITMGREDNIKGKGFDKRPENRWKHGRPKSLVNTINKELKDMGYKPAQPSQVREAYMILVNLPMTAIAEISTAEAGKYPLLYTFVAKELQGKRAHLMFDHLLDRGIGRAFVADDLIAPDAIEPITFNIIK